MAAGQYQTKDSGEYLSRAKINFKRAVSSDNTMATTPVSNITYFSVAFCRKKYSLGKAR